jgi:predicted transcriptional regulator
MRQNRKRLDIKKGVGKSTRGGTLLSHISFVQNTLLIQYSTFKTVLRVLAGRGVADRNAEPRNRGNVCDIFLRVFFF